MRIKVLMDNAESDGLLSEWGLSIYIEHGGKRILLDTGASAGFLENADRMGVDIRKVDFGVLSHAHYDHSDGMEAFFVRNDHAPFYLQACCKENCYSQHEDGLKYIGIKAGLLEKYADRLVRVEGRLQVAEDILLLPHATEGLEELGAQIGMFTKEDGCMKPERFAHEQSLVFETRSGLVVFSSCSHGGAYNIVCEAREALHGKRIHALIGGFHLFKSTEDEVRSFAGRMKEAGVERILTGHCTGDRGIAILKEVLGGCVEKMHPGLELCIE